MSTEITGHYVSIDGTRIFYDACGEGTPFVGVHTAGADAREYQYLLPLMAERGYRALALDLPGHGKSYPVGWEPHRTMHQHAELVHRFAQEVCPGEKPVVAGCSIGGCMAFDLAAHHSEDYTAIVPMEGLPDGSPILPHPGEAERPSWSTAWRPFLEYAAVESLGKPTLADAEKVKELWWQHQNAQQAGNGDIQAWAGHDVRELLGDVRCPILIIKGADDFWVPELLIRAAAELIGEQAEVAVLDDIGHYPMYEDPALVARLIDEFVRARAGVAAAR
ncbi:MAG: alpha/beta hydrolase [Conexibacter sp.]|nr:alpha/beta hydrolase [Conexibacter sp.]